MYVRHKYNCTNLTQLLKCVIFVFRGDKPAIKFKKNGKSKLRTLQDLSDGGINCCCSVSYNSLINELSLIA